MGWLGNLIGTEKAVDNVLDSEKGLLVKFGGFLNNLHESDAEKTEANAEIRKFSIDYMQAMAPFKVVQRILVANIAGVWTFVAVNLVVAIWIKAVWPQIDAVTMLWQFAISDYVFYPAILAFSIYLSGGVIKPGLFGGKTK